MAWHGWAQFLIAKWLQGEFLSVWIREGFDDRTRGDRREGAGFL